MHKIGFLLAVVVCCLMQLSETAKSINSHLTSTDLERFQQIFTEGIKSNDIQSIYYGAINSKKLAKDAEEACARFEGLHKESKLNDFEKNFYLAVAYKKLSCTSPIAPAVQEAIQAKKEFTTAQELYFNYFAHKTLGFDLNDELRTKLAKNLQTILKKDDSLTSLGYAFYVAADLGQFGAPIADWIEGAIAQADEVDGKLLQFEGGLSITALILNGAFKLTTALQKPAPINDEQAVKFTRYLLSRRSVQLVKGASVLLEVLETISKNKNLAPVCIQVIGNGQIQPDSPVINVKIVDILGKSLSPAIASVTATAVSKSDKTALVSNAALTAKSSDKTVYSLDLTTSKPTRGSYSVEVSADNYKQTIEVKILGKVKVSSLEIGVGESDSTSSLKKQTVDYPNKLSADLNADAQQKIVLRTVLVDEANGKPLTVHQAFVRLENAETKEEIIFVAEQDSSKAYKFDMDVGARSADFGHKSGLYSVELIIGDASLSNSFIWHVANVQLKFSQEPKATSNEPTKGARKEIVHQFREPEVRPARFVSNLFTALCVAPLLVLFALWAKLKVNVSNFPFSLWSIGFHAGFGAILGLFFIFFCKLNMFDTIRYLIPLALVTFFCGNRLLRNIAAKKAVETKNN